MAIHVYVKKQGGAQGTGLFGNRQKLPSYLGARSFVYTALKKKEFLAIFGKSKAYIYTLCL